MYQMKIILTNKLNAGLSTSE